MYVEQSGGCFIVLIFEDHVKKIPRVKSYAGKKVKEMADLQNEIANKVEGALPCEYSENGYIKMQIAPGVRVDKLTEAEQEEIEPLRQKLINNFREAGYDIGDAKANNLFYDKANNKLYTVDYHLVKRDGD